MKWQQAKVLEYYRKNQKLFLDQKALEALGVQQKVRSTLKIQNQEK